MPKEFIMRGQTAMADPIEVLNMSGYRPGYGYRLIAFEIFPSSSIGGSAYEMMGAITAGNTAVSPQDPDFNDDGLIATTFVRADHTMGYPIDHGNTIINDLFVITQDLLLQVHDTQLNAVNWQVRFKEVKLSAPAEAVANFKQYTIYNTSS